MPGVGASFIEGAMTRDYTRVMGAVILYGGLNPLGGSKAVERLPILALDEFSLSKLTSQI